MMAKRRKAPRMGLREPDKIVCYSHAKWVRGHCCLIQGKGSHECLGRIEAHHSTTRGAGGGDETLVPLCSGAHSLGHTIGWQTFEKRFAVDLEKLAADLWRASPHRRKWEQSQAPTLGDAPE